MQVSLSDAASIWSVPFGEDISVDLSIAVEASLNKVDLIVGLYSLKGFEIASWSNKSSGVELPVRQGINAFRIAFQKLKLLPGHYFIEFLLLTTRGVEDYVPETAHFTVVSNAEAARIDAATMTGALIPEVEVSILDRL